MRQTEEPEKGLWSKMGRKEGECKQGKERDGSRRKPAGSVGVRWRVGVADAEEGMSRHNGQLQGASEDRPDLRALRLGFSQRLFSRSWGGPRGPNSQGKAKPHVQVSTL